jgi:serine/threonine protein kinase
MVQACGSLQEAHGRGLLHRDIKPSNIMLTLDNEVRLIDFGIAILNDSDLSMIQGIAGSPSYMSPEQIQSADLTSGSDIYSLGAVMYELLSGFRPFRADDLSKLLNQIVYATSPPIHTLRADVPEGLEDIVATAMQKEPKNRFATGGDLAARLTQVYKQLRKDDNGTDEKEHFALLRRLQFFHDFSHAEIWELLRASEWLTYESGDAIVKEGEMDDRFYVIVSGRCSVESNGLSVGHLDTGNCFGETSYVSDAKRNATIKAEEAMIVLRVSSTLLEQVSTECQLRFNKVFLRSLIERLQGTGDTQT